MIVAIRLPGALRQYADGASTVTVQVQEQSTLETVLRALAECHPDVARRVWDETGTVRIHVNVFVGDDNARDVGGLAAPVPAGADVVILPAVSGGR